jgi:hypothetical protein
MKPRIALFLLLSLNLATASGAPKREVVPVPTWNALDGTQWGPLALERTTRAEFERDYSSAATALPSVMKGNTSGRTNTELFVAFDGPGPDARLAWVVCFYGGDRGAPAALEFEGRYGPQMEGGYPPVRHAEWRLRVATEQGVAAVIERGPEKERVAALIAGTPALVAALARRLSERPTEVESLLGPEDREPLVARVASVEVDVDVDRDVRADRRELRRELERAAEREVRVHSSLRLGSSGGGRVAVSVDVEPRKRREEAQIRITARATLDGEGPYGIVSASSGESTRDLDGNADEVRIEREARRLVEQVVGSVASSAQNQLQSRRNDALAAARRQTRLGLVAFLAGE